MTEVIARIVLRYIAGALILNGFIPDELGKSLMSDPQVIQVLNVAFGFAVGAVAEGWYWLAKKFGWRT